MSVHDSMWAAVHKAALFEEKKEEGKKGKKANLECLGGLVDVALEVDDDLLHDADHTAPLGRAPRCLGQEAA
eukprot:3116838-Rhodomonas_salina.1